jgi:hypothetical protein
MSPNPSPVLERSPDHQSPDQPPRKRTEPREYGVSRPNAYGLPHTEANQSPPIALSEPQMCALLAASYPLPPTARSAFLEHCAREIANLPELGDGVLHRTIVRVQRMYFDPPDLDGRMPRTSKWER